MKPAETAPRSAAVWLPLRVSLALIRSSRCLLPVASAHERLTIKAQSH